MIALEGSAVEAAATSRLHDYLRRAQPVGLPLDEDDELIARDAYVQGFRSGGRWAIQTSSRLSDPEVQRAIAVLHELVRDRDEQLVDGYREAHAELATELIGLRGGVLNLVAPHLLVEVVDRCLALLTPPRRIALQVTR